jgi:hypothetical protein
MIGIYQFDSCVDINENRVQRIIRSGGDGGINLFTQRGHFGDVGSDGFNFFR